MKKLRAVMHPLAIGLASIGIGALPAIALGQSATQVCVFTGVNFQGPSECFSPGTALVRLVVTNNQVSSIQVPSGVRVVAFGQANGMGPRRQFDQSIANLRDARFDNRISALQIASGNAPPPAPTPSPAPGPTPVPAPSPIATTELQVIRGLQQGSFGATPAQISQVSQRGLAAWIAEQRAMPLDPNFFERRVRAVGTDGALGAARRDAFQHAFWERAATAPDQLRQRLTYALSQMFVISFQDSNIRNYAVGAASYYDMLQRHALGNYRDLLEGVSTHPMMGLYLTHIRNERSDGTRMPDENYAREIMQLFSIGLVALNPDGTPVVPRREVYTNEDITGLAKVFTGWSWHDPSASGGLSTNANRFRRNGITPGGTDAGETQPMSPYPAFHSIEEKRFLGAQVPAGVSDPRQSLRVALDTLFNHPNTAPFVSRQLIQRLVTSNPSPAYVRRVAAVFENNGRNIRGDLGAVTQAILLDPEALTPATGTTSAGKLREPVLRLAHWIRAFEAQPSAQGWTIPFLDNPGTQLGQSPMNAPSVFNYYRPGYTPVGTPIAAANLVAPEFQITHETSVAGYANFMQGVTLNGIGGVRTSYTAELPLAVDPPRLVDHLNRLLAAGALDTTDRTLIVQAVQAVPLRVGQETVDQRARVALAVRLVMTSPAYLVQK